MKKYKMKIELSDGAKTASIDDFGVENNLTMCIHNRGPNCGLPRYYAYFKGVEVYTRGGYASPYGEGETPDGAIGDYAKKISGVTISIRGQNGDRRFITAPQFIEAQDGNYETPLI